MVAESRALFENTQEKHFVTSSPDGTTAEGPVSGEEGVANDFYQMILQHSGLNSDHEPTFLSQITDDIKRGIDAVPTRLGMYASIETALGPVLLEAIETGVMYKNQPIPVDEWAYDQSEVVNFRDEETGVIHEPEVYEDLLTFYQEHYGEAAEVKLVKLGNEMVVVTDRMCGDGLRIIQVLEEEFPKTPEYEALLEKRRNGVFTEEDRHEMLRLFRKDGARENFIIARHVFLQDVNSNKVFDLRSFLPEDWELRLKLTTDLSGFHQDYTNIAVNYEDLTIPAKLAGLLHEIAHNLFTFNDIPEMAEQATNLWHKFKFSNGFAGLTEEDQILTKTLTVANERGATLYALQIMRMLKRNGLNLGASVSEVLNFVNSALKGYEDRMSLQGSKPFTRANTTLSLPRDK